jgi:hypothetical protein
LILVPPHFFDIQQAFFMQVSSTTWQNVSDYMAEPFEREGLMVMVGSLHTRQPHVHTIFSGSLSSLREE